MRKYINCTSLPRKGIVIRYYNNRKFHLKEGKADVFIFKKKFKFVDSLQYFEIVRQLQGKGKDISPSEIPTLLFLLQATH